MGISSLSWYGLVTMDVGAQKNLGGHQTFARKMRSNFARKAIGFSVVKVTSKKKKKRSSLKIRRFDEYEIVQNFDTNLPKTYEITQNFDAILPK